MTSFNYLGKLFYKVDAIVVYWLKCQSSKLGVLCFNPVCEATTRSKSYASSNRPTIVLRGQPATTCAVMVSNYSL